MSSIIPKFDDDILGMIIPISVPSQKRSNDVIFSTSYYAYNPPTLYNFYSTLQILNIMMKFARPMSIIVYTVTCIMKDVINVINQMVPHSSFIVTILLKKHLSENECHFALKAH